jgi:isopentenyl-diphosphate Delta-isomerase
MNNDYVVLVDANDNELGIMPKLEAHEKGVLHRAFSIFIMNDRHELLLQKRAAHKYHSANLWTNTCCSHPQKGDNVIDAGKLRLQQEMGFSVPLLELFSFIYHAQFENNLIEHELDYVLLGKYNSDPIINEQEVSDSKWISIDDLNIDIVRNPKLYTVWFREIFDKFAIYYWSQYQ